MRRLPRLADAGTSLDSTIAACNTLDAWLKAAGDFFTVIEVTRPEAESFLEARCAAMELSAAALCSTVDS